MDDPVFMAKLTSAVQEGREMDWLCNTFAYNSGVPLNETPITNFRNYRYKIVEIFKMTYKQEKAILDVEIATPDSIVLLGIFAEYKLASERLIALNTCIASNEHSWQKVLALAKHDIRLLVNMAFTVMHLFAGDMTALSDNEIVYCYILAAALIGVMDKNGRAKLDRDIQRQGLKRPQHSITDRASQSPKIPKDSSRSETAYCKAFMDILQNDTFASTQAAKVDIFIATAKRLSIRKECLQQMAQMGKDLPQVGRLLHLGRIKDLEPQQLGFYVGEERMASPASSLGEHRYKKPGSRSSVTRKNSRW